MPTPIALTETLLEGTTGIYSFPIVDESGQAVASSFIETLTLTLFDLDSDQILNGRQQQDILNTNDGTLTTSVGPKPLTTVTLQLQPEDTAIVNQQRLVEYRVLVFEWTWDLGRRKAAHCVQFGVENLPHTP